MDTAALLQVRMEEEIGHMAPLAGLCGEFELDTTRMDAATTAGVLAEYCLDTLRGEGWWIQLNSLNGKSAGAAPRNTLPRQSISFTEIEAARERRDSTSDKDKTKDKPPSPTAKRLNSVKLGLSLGTKKKSFSAR
jgi:hypothetical protein